MKETVANTSHSAFLIATGFLLVERMLFPKPMRCLFGPPNKPQNKLRLAGNLTTFAPPLHLL